MSAPAGSAELVALRCAGVIGAYAAERESAREILVDIVCHGDAVTDVAELAACARTAVGARPRALLERLAADIAADVLARFGGIREVAVRVAKPDPPGLDAAAEAVALTLARPTR